MTTKVKPDGYIRNSLGQFMDIFGANNPKYRHGYAGTKEYLAWKNARNRCTDPKRRDFHNYGGRGIRMCQRWLNNPDVFCLDMGVSPAGTVLGRIDNNGNYEPSNCRWESKLENDNNKRTCRYLESNGQRMSITQWARYLGVSANTLSYRIKRGWSIDRALTVNSYLGNNQHRNKLNAIWPEKKDAD